MLSTSSCNLSGERHTIGTGAIVLVDTANPRLKRAAAFLVSEMTRLSGQDWRIAAADDGKSAVVVLRMAADGDGCGSEELSVDVLQSDGRVQVEVVAGGDSVVLAAVGQLLRRIDVVDGNVRPLAGIWRFRPSCKVRGQVLANHKQTNTFDLWTYEEWERYLTELAAWGNNLIVVYPAQPSRWHGSLPYATPPWFDSEARRKEWDRQMAIQARIPALCRELGMRYGVYLSPNDIWPQQVINDPSLAKNSASFVCPNIPAARREITALRKTMFEFLDNIDVLFIPSRDDGGCPGCPDCDPWSAPYIDLVEEQSALVRSIHPDCTIWLSQQGLAASDAQHVLNWLSETKPDYVEGVVYGPFSETMTFSPADGQGGGLSLEQYPGTDFFASGPARLRSALDVKYALLQYPDEVHPFQSQYPIVEMDPLLQYVWARQDAPVPRIMDTIRQYKGIAPTADGIVPYSEGNTDDINKFAWTALMWNPGATAEEIAFDYANTTWGRDAAETGAQLILAIERALNGAVQTDGDVSLRRLLVGTVEAANPSVRSDWRWTSLVVCVELIEHAKTVFSRDRELAAILRYRVAEWIENADLRDGLARTIAYLDRRLSESDASLRSLVGTRSRLFEQHKLRIRAVARAQRSYQGFDTLRDAFNEILERIETGALPTWSEQHREIKQALERVELKSVNANIDRQVVDHLQEFAWETGKVTW